MHDVACEFARAAVRSKDAQKQKQRLNSLHVYPRLNFPPPPPLPSTRLLTPGPHLKGYMQWKESLGTTVD